LVFKKIKVYILTTDFLRLIFSQNPIHFILFVHNGLFYPISILHALKNRDKMELLQNYEHAHFQHRAEQLIGEKKAAETEIFFLSDVRENGSDF